MTTMTLEAPRDATKTGASALSRIVSALGARAARWQWGTRPATAPRPTRARARAGAYVLLDKLGEGTMGEVYRARHAASGQLRAVKLLVRSTDERQRRQFEREAQLGALLCHPHKVSIYGHGETLDGTPYLVMELLEGISLEDLVARDGTLPARRVAGISSQLAQVLAEVHEHGVVHRDVKPSNIMLCRGRDGQEHVKLLDFGLVKQLAEPSPSASLDHVVGTPLYIAPESLTAPETVDGRTDIYGLGAVAYHLLEGAPVFGGRNLVEVCAHHLLTPPAPLRGVASGSISTQLGQLILDCLAKDPAARPANARELLRRLRRCPELAGSTALPMRRPAVAQPSPCHSQHG